MNDFFHFKQFSIMQSRCAMKVTEMACIQGAWTKIHEKANNLLDLGFGTGLLSLMIAQQYPKLEIDAIEIDNEAFLQGSENISSSKFANQISTMHGDVKTYELKKKYDFIICNPPFFENQLVSESLQKNKAWHSVDLSLAQLIKIIQNNLADNGKCSLMFPMERKEDVQNQLLNCALYPQHYLYIYHNENKVPKYFICIYGKQMHSILESKLIIRDGSNYTKEMSSLMKDFYLKL